MKLNKALVAAVFAAACVIPFSGLTAGAADTTSLTVVNADQFSAENLSERTICVDDVLVQSGEKVINSAIDTTPGTHAVKMAFGTHPDCDDADVD